MAGRPRRAGRYFYRSDTGGGYPRECNGAAPLRRAVCSSHAGLPADHHHTGFDTVAEAFWLGIPVFLLPSENHYEQYCNALDAARTGLAFPLENLSDLSDTDFVPVENSRFRKWAGEGWERGLLYDPIGPDKLDAQIN